MPNRIIYPGTFDPITNGHIDLIERASNLFSEVVVAIAANKQKNTIFNLKEREKFVGEAVAKYSNVKICTFSGLLIDLARKRNSRMVLRGLRAISDFEYELQLASVNRIMEPHIETVFLTPAEKYAYVSSSIVREIASLGGDVSLFVPQIVEVALKNRFLKQNS